MTPDPSPPLTPEELQEMKGRCIDCPSGLWGKIFLTEGGKREEVFVVSETDAGKIANCMLDLPRLIAEIERLHTVLGIIREAGQNEDVTAGWMQRWAAWGMEPNKWPKPTDTPSNYLG